MNEKLDLAEILKDYPKGTKLYSPVYGDVELMDVSQDNVPYSIKTKTNSNLVGMFSTVSFTKDGRIFAEHNGECMLFPSKDQRDWSRLENKKPKFKVGDKIVNIRGKNIWTLSGSQGIISEITYDKYIFTDGSYTFISNQDNWELAPDKKPKFDPNTLKTFDRVLVRDGDGYTWQGKLFSHINNTSNIYKYATSGDFYEYCIPYNDDTKHLVGTRDEAPEYYRYWEE